MAKLENTSKINDSDHVRRRRAKAVFLPVTNFVITVLVSAVATIFTPELALARLASFESAPLHIKRHDVSINVATDGSWTMKGFLELKVNTAAGRLAIAAYKLPLGDELEELKVKSAEVLEPTATRAIPLGSIVLRDVENAPGRMRPPFFGMRAYTIPFGDLPVGTVTRISYEGSLKRPRIPGLFSMAFDWGVEYPQLAGSITLASSTPLYLDVSRAGRTTLSFSKGRGAGGVTVWRTDLKTPVYVKTDGEVGGLLTTTSVPRLQVSNKVGWSPIIEALAPRYASLATESLPHEFQKIIEKAKTLTKTEERFNIVIDMLNAFVSYRREWSPADGGYTPQKMSAFALAKRGDAKDFAFAAAMILRALGYNADVALVWRQSPTEKIWIDETPTTPSLQIFNHAVVRVNEKGRVRYFDPTNPVSFSEGHLSDIAGSWALAITKGPQAFARIPVDSPVPSTVKIVQNLDLRPDASVVGSGTVRVEGPLAAELKQLYQSQGAAQIEPYLRGLFALAPQGEMINPMIRVSSQDPRGGRFDLNFSYLAPNAIRQQALPAAQAGSQPMYREFDMLLPGLTGVPLLSAKDRATDVMLTRGLTLEIETKVVGGDVTDETNTSCVALTSFASLLRETRASAGYFIQNDFLQFKSDRISATLMRTPTVQSELATYGNCLAKTRVSTGPRPAFERSPLGLVAQEVGLLKKPVALLTLQDVQQLGDIKTPQLQNLIGTKVWLAVRELMRKNIRTPQVMLEYAGALLETGHTRYSDRDLFLPGHVAEAAKMFSSIGPQLAKSAKFHRIHATMLLATERPKEALVALQNATALEPAQARDSLFASAIYDRMQNPAKSEEMLRLATTQRGSRATRVAAIQELASLRLKAGKTADFINLYKQAIAEAPQNAWIYHDFARLLQDIKMLDLSIEQSQKAIRIIRFPEAEATLARSLIMKAEGYYYSAPGIPTLDPQALAMADKLALECLKYSRTELLAYRIAGHTAFLKAMTGDYGSLIATQSYFSKVVELAAAANQNGARSAAARTPSAADDVSSNPALIADSWLRDRLAAANQALETSRPLTQIWSAMSAAKGRALGSAGGAPMVGSPGGAGASGNGFGTTAPGQGGAGAIPMPIPSVPRAAPRTK